MVGKKEQKNIAYAVDMCECSKCGMKHFKKKGSD